MDKTDSARIGKAGEDVALYDELYEAARSYENQK
jgi:hypothetical protein